MSDQKNPQPTPDGQAPTPDLTDDTLDSVSGGCWQPPQDPDAPTPIIPDLSIRPPIL